eukprot:m.417294 g.417294  ORF g.417294 m.417294 type:complete len:556 (-) comp16833_c0_seq13:1162-2829(-)
MLLQRGPGQLEQPIAFISRVFTGAETRWSTVEQEGFAIYWAVKSLPHFLEGVPFEIETDHRNLLWLYKATAPKLVRWRLLLAGYDFTVHHIPGQCNVVADALSRLFGPAAACHSNTAQPSATALDVASVHNDTVGHHGVSRTMTMLEATGVELTPTVRHAVSQFIACCAMCQKFRLRQRPPAAALHTTAVEEPFTTLALDTVGPLPADHLTNRYILVMTDSFTRYTELYASPAATADAAVSGLLQVVCRYGLFKQLRSDQGSQFTADVIEQLCQLLNVDQRFSMPYRPQANGTVERCNQEVMRHLCVLTNGRRVTAKWSKYLPLVQRIMNATPNRVTGVSPAQLLFGNAVNLNRQLLEPPAAQRLVTLDDHLADLIRVQQHLSRAARLSQRAHVNRYLEQSPDSPTTYEVGDMVLCSYPNRPPSKLHPKWQGPFSVVHIDGNTHVLRSPLGGDDREVHTDRLKPYKPDPVDSAAEIAILDQQLWLVEKIIDHKGSPRTPSKMMFLVRWQDFDARDDTWEAYTDLSDLAALEDYCKSKNLKLGTSKAKTRSRRSGR